MAETLVIAEAVTGVDAAILAKASRLDLLDSALHAPQAGFGEEDFYPAPEQKAAVLAVRIARNHPLPEKALASEGFEPLEEITHLHFLGLDRDDRFPPGSLSSADSRTYPVRVAPAPPR